jgi:hypothetical protein
MEIQDVNSWGVIQIEDGNNQTKKIILLYIILKSQYKNKNIIVLIWYLIYIPIQEKSEHFFMEILFLMIKLRDYCRYTYAKMMKNLVFKILDLTEVTAQQQEVHYSNP